MTTLLLVRRDPVTVERERAGGRRWNEIGIIPFRLIEFSCCAIDGDSIKRNVSMYRVLCVTFHILMSVLVPITCDQVGG